MKKTALIIASAIALSSFPFVSAYASDEITCNDMTFEFYKDDTLSLAKYSGTSPNLEVPAEVDGYKVVRIKESAFSSNKVVKNVTLPDTIEYIGTEAFRFSALESINIPPSVQFIPDFTFENCQHLKNVGFHENIIGISNTAFDNTSIEIPESLKECVTENTVFEGGCYIRSGDFAYSISKEINDCAVYQYFGNDTELILPSSLKGLPVTQYGGFPTRDSVVSFVNKDITSIVFPENATEIKYDFSYLPNLKNITFLGNNITIQYYKTNFSALPIEEIALPVQKIASSFAGNETLKKVDFTGSGDLDIYQKIFSDCKNLEQVTFSGDYENILIGIDAFADSGISQLEISSPCHISGRAFESCSNLKKISLTDAEIEKNAFLDCNNLVSVEFKGNCRMDRNSFLDCSAIENVNIDISGSILGDTFNGCKSLTKINNVPVFDSKTGGFNKEYEAFIRKNFYMAEDVGFLNSYTEAQFKKVVEENTNDSMSDTEKVKVLHDWVCEHTKYADSIIPPEYHTDASILLNDSTVCEGYAKACNLLFNYAGIETYYINSFSHAWNIVKLGGHYFHIDSTWDDGDEISYDWFLKSDSEMTESHGTWKADKLTSLHDFQKSGTPECKYMLGDTNMDGSVNVADAVKMTRYILAAESETADNIVLYDMNFDGKTNVFDMIEMRNRIVN